MTFKSSLQAALSSRGISPKTFCDFTNIAEFTILKEYGAVFLADLHTKAEAAATATAISISPFPFSPIVGEIVGQSIMTMRVKIPSKCIFDNSSEVDAFQKSVLVSKENIGGITIELQAKAMFRLQEAVAEARTAGLTITPKPDATGARRSYADTVTFWNNKINDGVAHWTANPNKAGKKLSKTEGDNLKALSGSAQIKKVLELEKEGFFFSTHKNKTILRSVAAPGTSQHLLMLALDIQEFGNKKVREVMAKHGWLQTVLSDHPHFTYLGMSESSLGSLGLIKKTDGGQDFWIPDL